MALLCNWKLLFHVHLYIIVGSVMILNQPQDVSVREGETAVFSCTFNGTNDIPWWIISGSAYPFDRLPFRHSYHDQMLYVSNVKLSDNSSTYQCIFQDDTRSNIATLYINNSEPDAAMKLFTSNTALKLVTSYWQVYYGATGGCGTFLIVFTIVTATLLFYKYKKYQKQSAILQVHVYEDIQELYATRNTDPSSSSRTPNMAADYIFTNCPAYAASGQVPPNAEPEEAPLPHTSQDDTVIIRAPEYEDIQQLQATRITNPSNSFPAAANAPNMAAEYVYTQCPAYAASAEVTN